MFLESNFEPHRPQAVHERLADALSEIKQTEGKWFDGTLGSIEKRKDTLSRALSMTRQISSSSDLASPSALSATQIEGDLRTMYATVDHASKNFVSNEIVDAQRELPHFRINVMDY